MFTYYTVQKGDTLTSIADKFGTRAEQLQKANGIHDPDKISAGDMLIVPVTGWEPPAWWQNGMIIFELPAKEIIENLYTLNQMNERNESGCTAYTVQEGDNINSIARRMGTTVNVLRHINGQKTLNNIKAGDVICVPDKEDTYIYAVRPGDSIYMIAKRFSVPAERILQANYMNAEDIILPGMQLVIPLS